MGSSGAGGVDSGQQRVGYGAAGSGQPAAVGRGAAGERCPWC